MALTARQDRSQREALSVCKQVNLGGEPASQNRQVHSRVPGLRLRLAWFEPLFIVVRSARGGSGFLDDGAMRAQLGPVDATLGIEFTLQVPCIRLKGAARGPASEPVVNSLPVTIPLRDIPPGSS